MNVRDRARPPCPNCGTFLYDKYYGQGGWAPTDLATGNGHFESDCVRVLKAQLAAERDDRRRALRKMDELTLGTQTLEEGVAAPVDMVRDAREGRGGRGDVGEDEGAMSDPKDNDPVIFDATGRGMPTLWGFALPAFPPEYLVLAMPQNARLKEARDIDDPRKLVERILSQVEGGALVPLEHDAFQTVRRRILALGCVEVPDGNWPFTFLVGASPYRLVVSVRHPPSRE
jgi:hypothetical protein